MENLQKFYINGEWVNPLSDATMAVLNPATEQQIGLVALGNDADVDRAVAAANAAFEGFSQTSKDERLALLGRVREITKARFEDLAQAMRMEMGAPITMSRDAQTDAAIGHLDGFIAALEEFEERVTLANGDIMVREPIGVCGLITPWNWPMNQITLKVGAAIVSGCTMVLKPSEESPLDAMIFAELIDEAGFPKGVFNLVNGDGVGVGSQMSSHKDIDMISFTGSTRAGTLISKAAADTLKKVHLELGGKGANIIFNDADDKAVKRGVLHMMNNTGQSCNAPSRMLVQSDVYDKAVEEAGAVASQVTVGPASEDGRHIGPVVNESQFNKIQDLIQKGIDEGARLVAGGTGRPDGLNRGFFVKPTVFADVTPDMTIAREEIFGPVLSIMKFDSEEQAVQIANDTVYGLTNYVQSQDGERRNRLARQLRSGMVEMNGQSRAAGSPFGGMKQSGNGREGGMYGIEDFTEIKAVSGWAAE